MIAIIQSGGKQYLVKEGQVLRTEKLELEDGATIEFDALLVTEADGAKLQVGAPTVAGAKVKAVVVETGRGVKIPVVKFKRKVRYRRNVGHRQPFTDIKIESITA